MPRNALELPIRQPIYDTYGYAPGVASGELVFISGQVGVDDHGAPVIDSVAQARQAFANLSEVLKVAGCTFDDIIDVTSFHVDFDAHFDAFGAAKRDAFPAKPYPAWTAIGVTSLADPALFFEIKVVARIP